MSYLEQLRAETIARRKRLGMIPPKRIPFFKAEPEPKPKADHIIMPPTVTKEMIDKIVNTVSTVYGMPADKIKSSKAAAYTYPRYVCFYTCWKITRASSPAISKCLGISTFHITNGIRRVKNSLMAGDLITQGAIEKIEALLEIKEAKISSEFKELTEQIFSVNEILLSVCKALRKPYDEIKGVSRNKELIIPRHIFYYLSREFTNSTFIEIGRYCGGRDHSTIFHGIMKINDLLLAKNDDVTRDVTLVMREMLEMKKLSKVA